MMIINLSLPASAAGQTARRVLVILISRLSQETPTLLSEVRSESVSVYGMKNLFK